MTDQFIRPSVKSFTHRGGVECKGCVELCSCTQGSWNEQNCETTGTYLQSKPQTAGSATYQDLAGDVAKEARHL